MPIVLLIFALIAAPSKIEWLTPTEYDFGTIPQGKPVKMVLKHKDGSKEEVSLKHTYNTEQIRWFVAGSALNLIRGL